MYPFHRRVRPAVVGLTDREVEAKPWSTASAVQQGAQVDPPNAVALTPAQVANLCDFPAAMAPTGRSGCMMEIGRTPAGSARSE